MLYFSGGIGLQSDILELLVKETIQYEGHKKYVGLLQDEVRIKSDLVYNKHTGMYQDVLLSCLELFCLLILSNGFHTKKNLLAELCFINSREYIMVLCMESWLVISFPIVTHLILFIYFLYHFQKVNHSILCSLCILSNAYSV